MKQSSDGVFHRLYYGQVYTWGGHSYHSYHRHLATHGMMTGNRCGQLGHPAAAHNETDPDALIKPVEGMEVSEGQLSFVDQLTTCLPSGCQNRSNGLWALPYASSARGWGPLGMGIQRGWTLGGKKACISTVSFMTDAFCSQIGSNKSQPKPVPVASSLPRQCKLFI